MTHKATILCIEDEKLLLEDLKEELQDAGYQVLTACNGQEGFDCLGQHVPDLIICDMMMPVMSGPELLARIRSELPRLTRVPFIFLTALATRDDIIQGKKLGADDYLTKPLDFDMLLATVEARLNEVRRIDGAHRAQLLQIEKAIRQSRQARGPLRISLVSGLPKVVEPIRAALEELGCEITLVPEEKLKHKSYTFDRQDIVLLVYSKFVHYFLQYMTREGIRPPQGKMMLLAPPNMSDAARAGLLETGIDGFLDYPYRPVEVFKLLMDRLQPA
ncbi:response regulator [Stappia indica]|uniref:Response regulator n=1 Tax=Stappia indica TaxID=538381 RepID=A0A857C3N8_9HYPH|nr:response regulator [Stappia indica]QGZ33489.1 response regulator [Stappia indica]